MHSVLAKYELVLVHKMVMMMMKLWLLQKRLDQLWN